MGLFDGFVNNFENGWQGGNKLLTDAANGIGKHFGYSGPSGDAPFGVIYDPTSQTPQGSPLQSGSADSGSSMSPTSSSDPVSAPAYLNSSSGINPSGSTVNSSGADPSMQGQQSPSLNNAVMSAFVNGISTPAMDQQLLEKTFNGLKAVSIPNYLDLTQNAFKTMQSQVQNMQNAIHGGYDQAKMDIGDIYNSNQNAARMDGNNILQQIAQNEGNAIQGSAQGNMNALANLKNSELATRAAVAAKGGMPQAAGDNKSDPADVAAAGMLANAQAQAAHAQASAGDRVNSNNLMVDAMGSQNALMQNQLNNNRLGYDASVGKYMTDLTNQEAQREMDAASKTHDNEMQLRSMLYNMNKDNADMNIKKVAAFSGSRGVPAALQDIGIANMDNAKAMATQAQAGNVDPAQTALQKYPQLAASFNKALANGIGLAGSKPAWTDIYKSMSPMVQGDPSVSPDDLVNFAQMAAASKANNADSPYDMMMSQFQGQ